MSSHKQPIRLSPEAQKDFTGILRYTGERWGREQLLLYRAKLHDALMLLGVNPELGHQSVELPATHRIASISSEPMSSFTGREITQPRLCVFCTRA